MKMVVKRIFWQLLLAEFWGKRERKNQNFYTLYFGKKQDRLKLKHTQSPEASDAPRRAPPAMHAHASRAGPPRLTCTWCTRWTAPSAPPRTRRSGPWTGRTGTAAGLGTSVFRLPARRRTALRYIEWGRHVRKRSESALQNTGLTVWAPALRLPPRTSHPLACAATLSGRAADWGRRPSHRPVTASPPSGSYPHHSDSNFSVPEGDRPRTPRHSRRTPAVLG